MAGIWKGTSEKDKREEENRPKGHSKCSLASHYAYCSIKQSSKGILSENLMKLNSNTIKPLY